MKKIDWIKLVKAVGIAIMLFTAVFVLVWLAKRHPWALLGLLFAYLVFLVYRLLEERRRTPVVDEKEYIRGFEDGKKATWEDSMHTVVTWEDVKAIVEIAEDLLPDPRYKQDLDASFQTEESYYREVLRRYREGLK